MTTKAFAYLRVSGRSQIDGDGFPRQREAIILYASTHGLELVGEFRDEGVSGTRELAEREGLGALLNAIEANGVRTVVVERADRLARDLIVNELLLQKFRDLGVSVIEAEGGNDLTANDNPTGKLVRQMLAAFAEFEKDMIVNKLKAARDRIRESGGHADGVLPFGSLAGESDTLAEILKLNDLGPSAIARRLNTQGVPTRSGKPWSRQVISRILSRELNHAAAN